MGTANLYFAKKKIDEAIKMAFEVIRNCPGCPEPYQLIREVLLEKGLELMAHRLSLFIATIDTSTDSDTWLALATDRLGLKKQLIFQNDRFNLNYENI